MAKEYRLLALDVWRNLQEGTFPAWALRYLNSYSSYPWQGRTRFPVGMARESACSIEVIGLPASGKTTAIQFVESNAGLGKRLIVMPELVVTGGPYGSPISARDVPDQTPLGWEFVQLFYERVKLAATVEGMKSVIALAEEEARMTKRLPGLVIGERNANDAIAFLGWIGHFAMNKQEVPADWEEPILEEELRFDRERWVYPGFGKTMLELFIYSLALSQWVDAVILFGVELDTAQRRREEMDKPPGGRVVNPESWPVLKNAFSWWLGSIYPLLRKYHGTGLLVVNGEKSVERNNLRVLNYCRRLIQLQGV